MNVITSINPLNRSQSSCNLMYVEEIVTKGKGKEYRTLLVRESFRKGSSVYHRTIANISHLPQGCIEEIKRYLKGNSGNLDFSQVQVINSKEYGASQSLLSFARKLELGNIIFSQKVQWREDILAMVAGRLLYPGNEIFLTSIFADTLLWESCGHSPDRQPNVNKHCYNSLNHLLSRQKTIQKKLKEKHLEKKSAALLFLTSTIVEEEREYSEFSIFNTEHHKYKEASTLLFTNLEGCPLAVKIFSNESNITHKEVQKEFTQSIILIGTQEMVEKVVDKEFKTISILTLIQTSLFLEKNLISPSLFLNDPFYELQDPTDASMRYILYVSVEKKIAQEKARNERIKKTEELLLGIKKKKNITLEIENILRLFETEEFFSWHIEKERLHFSLNTSQIVKQEQLDGCCMVRTNVEKDILTTQEVINASQKLNSVQHAFRMIKTMTTTYCPVSLENRIRAHQLLCMLTHYLQWHINKKLEIAIKKNKESKVQCWTLPEVIEKLKSIRSQTVKVGEITLETVKTTLDEEQREIISALGVSLMTKLSK
jgi:hypothetical protein